MNVSTGRDVFDPAFYECARPECKSAPGLIHSVDAPTTRNIWWHGCNFQFASYRVAVGRTLINKNGKERHTKTAKRRLRDNVWNRNESVCFNDVITHIKLSIKRIFERRLFLLSRRQFKNA